MEFRSTKDLNRSIRFRAVELVEAHLITHYTCLPRKRFPWKCNPWVTENKAPQDMVAFPIVRANGCVGLVDGF
ncbi:MAG: hypothetical protein ACFFCJ_10620, partial [Promethearchaeota archaeon]